MVRKRRLFNQLDLFPLRFLPFLFNYLEMSQAQVHKDLGFDRQYISTMLKQGRCTRIEEVFNLGKRLKLTDEQIIQVIMLYVLTVRKAEEERVSP